MDSNLELALKAKKCSITGMKLELCDSGEETNSGGVLVLNTNYGEPTDGINCDAGTECIVISKEVMNKTLEFWKTLDNYKPNKLVKLATKYYKEDQF